MIVIDFETGRGVIVQSETHMDGPWGVGGANEPRPISLNGDRGAWDNMGGIDLDMTNQIDLSSDEDGVHVDWDILNSITPLAISVDGDVDFERGRRTASWKSTTSPTRAASTATRRSRSGSTCRRLVARDRAQRLPGRAQPGPGRAAALRPAERAGPADDRDRRLSRVGHAGPARRAVGPGPVLVVRAVSYVHGYDARENERLRDQAGVARRPAAPRHGAIRRAAACSRPAAASARRP